MAQGASRWLEALPYSRARGLREELRSDGTKLGWPNVGVSQ